MGEQTRYMGPQYQNTQEQNIQNSKKGFSLN